MDLAKGDVSGVTTVQVLQLEQSLKRTEDAGAFRIGQRYKS